MLLCVVNKRRMKWLSCGLDLEHGFHDLYVYCDIIQSQYVGDALVPLLRIVPVEGKDGERFSKSFIRPQYLPVSRKQFETIEVNIKPDTGEFVPFEFGRVLLPLHFRQSRPVNFWKDEENSHPKSQVVWTVLLRSSQAKGWEFTSFSRCSISARSWIRFHI